MFLNAPWKSFYVNLPFERLFVTFWKLIRSHAVTPRWLDDAKEFIQSGWRKQRDSCSSEHEIPAADAGRFESRISRKLFGSYHLDFKWIFDWMPREEVSTFQFSWCSIGSLVNQISWLKSAWRRSGLWLTLLLCNCCYKRSLRNNPRNETNICRLNVT